MRWRLWRDAAIGLAVGCLLVGLVVLLPRWLQDDFYEVEDALLVMGIPLVTLGTAVGYMIGVRHQIEAESAGPASAPRTAAVRLVVAVAFCVLAVWLFLWGVGAVGVSPLGIG